MARKKARSGHPSTFKRGRGGGNLDARAVYINMYVDMVVSGYVSQVYVFEISGLSTATRCERL